jgi:C-terminal processing protease CtpA/Prc
VKGAGSVAVTLAEAAGIEPGDQIVSVDGHEVGSIEAARRRLTGPLGEDVVVALCREDDPSGSTVVRVRRERVRR